MNYKYWDDFVNVWKAIPNNNLKSIASSQINGWTSPNAALTLFNTPGIHSIKYIPEPWWGNDGRAPLNSIVINYNPGAGGEAQTHQNAQMLLHQNSYSGFVGKEASKQTNFFKGTNRWHQGKRAARIFNTLKRLNCNLGGYDKLINHLSIELIPWHTTNTSTIDSYIDDNVNCIFGHCFVFAANESKRIQNEKMNSKVILRVNDVRTSKLLNDIKAKKISDYSILCEGKSQSGKGEYMKFKFKSIPDVEFISIWGSESKNDFPPNNDMNQIFSAI